MMWAAIAVSMSGCGLVLDLDPLPADAGSVDAGGGMDASTDAAMDATPAVECEANTDCGPRDACGDHDVCRSGQCVPNTNVRTCDDFIDCTEDICVAGGECEHIPSAGRCGDTPDTGGCSGYRCDVERGCVLTEVDPCDDGIACTEDICLLDSGGCDVRAVNSRCPGSTCSVGAEGAEDTGCVPIGCAAASECPIDDPCVAEWACIGGVCMPEVLEAAGTVCPNTEPCAIESVCRSGLCVIENSRNCRDGNRCTLDRCDRMTGDCVNDPDAEVNGSECPGGSCTVGQCDDGVCTGAVSRCQPRPRMCETATCMGATNCQTGMPCAELGRACAGTAAGTCAGCLPGLANCDETTVDNYDCEWNVMVNGPCVADAGTPDGSIPDGSVSDGGVSDANVVDATTPPGDSGSPGDGGTCIPTNTLGECPSGYNDCNGDGCCNCGPEYGCALVGVGVQVCARSCAASSCVNPGDVCCAGFCLAGCPVGGT